MRLIDADALMKDVREHSESYWAEDFAEYWVNRQPTIQPQTGEWRFSPDDAEGICTVCQYKIYGRPYQRRYLIVPYNFCPNCGADMRGETG